MELHSAETKATAKNRLGRALVVTGLATLSAVNPIWASSANALAREGILRDAIIDRKIVVDPTPKPTPSPTPTKNPFIDAIIDRGDILIDVLQPVPTPVPNCNRSGEKVFGVGSTGTARGEVSGKGSIFAVANKQDATLEGKVRGCFIGQCANLARASVEGHSQGNSRALVEIAGLTVFTKPLSGSGQAKFGPKVLKVSLGGSVPVVPGIISLKLKAEFGVGSEMTVNYRVLAAPPTTNLSGNAKAFGFGSGGVGVSVLGGLVGSGSCDATLTLPGPRVQATLDAGVCTRNTASLLLNIDPWKLNAKLSWRIGCLPFIGCAYSDSKTLINIQGPAASFRMI